MTPLRLVIIGVLLYILYRLLIGPRRREGETAGRGRPEGGGPVQDVLVQDPVCHTYVPRQQAVVLKQGDRSLYFCSRKCRERFLGKAEAEGV